MRCTIVVSEMESHSATPAFLPLGHYNLLFSYADHCNAFLLGLPPGRIVRSKIRLLARKLAPGGRPQNAREFSTDRSLALPHRRGRFVGSLRLRADNLVAED